MPLEICVIDTDTGLLYEWNGSRTVNVYYAEEYVRQMEYTYSSAWTMGEYSSNPGGFIESVVDHVKGDT